MYVVSHLADMLTIRGDGDAVLPTGAEKMMLGSFITTLTTLTFQNDL